MYCTSTFAACFKDLLVLKISWTFIVNLSIEGEPSTLNFSILAVDCKILNEIGLRHATPI
jgi:hypothetical protein